MNARAYLELMRPVDGLMAAFAVLIGYFIAAGQLALLPLPLAMASVFFFSGAGIALNDYFDLEMDKVNAPNRPIPSGKIGKKKALCFSLALFALATALAAFINSYCLGLAALNVFLEIAYAWRLKKIALLGNFTDSWFPASSFLYGALASGLLGIVPWLALLAFLANAGREIFGDLEDFRGDKKHGAKTLPVLFGKKCTLFIGRAFIFSAVFLSPLPWLLGLLSMAYLPVVAIADAVFIYSAFSPPKKNQALTKAAMVIAMLAFVAGVLF